MARVVALPTGEAIFLDHLAHWVADIHAAGAALERLGFLLTPYAEHLHGAADGTSVPAGSANCCVMLEAGYLELLTPIGDTPIASEVRAALGRYTGLHLAAFAVEDAAQHRRRLVSVGFPQRACVSLARQSTTADGEACTLHFTVVRPEVGCLPEGRVQFLSHHTPDLLWQTRWLEHPNSARGLTDVLFCVADPREADLRYQRYLGRPAESIAGGCLVQTERGRLALLDAKRVAAVLPESEIPCVPFMAAYAVECKSVHKTRALLRSNKIDFTESKNGSLTVPLPPALGGTIAFTENGVPAPWL